MRHGKHYSAEVYVNISVEKFLQKQQFCLRCKKLKYFQKKLLHIGVKYDILSP